jgi:hypothetical protein
MKMSSRRIAGLVPGKLVTLSAAVAPAPAGGGTSSRRPTHPGRDGSAWRAAPTSSSAKAERDNGNGVGDE